VNYASGIPRPPRSALLLCLLAALLPAVVSARAADVTVQVSSREVYVGAPFRIAIEIEYENDYREPDLPDVPGLRILRPPSVSSGSYTQILGRQRTHTNTATFTYTCVADATGTFTIPPLTVTADGKQLRTQPVRLVATKSETGDLLFVDITAPRDSYYLGETIDLTLEIWLRPYQGSARGRAVRFDANDMWSRVDRGASAFGPFADTEVSYREALRKDADGVEHAYFVYVRKAPYTPRETGMLRLDDVRAVVDYPVSLGVDDGGFFFRRRIDVTESRPIVAAAEVRPIQISPLPADARPPVFAGAVGRFDIDVTAEPTTVNVGDPITITLTVTDLTGGEGRLESLQPPPLDRVQPLADNFRIPTDPLAGVVAGRRKTFTQTIRPKHDRITRIPSIPFAFFDPEQEQYATVRGDPIDIVVHPAVTLPMSEVVESGAAASAPAAAELTEVAGGIVANYAGADQLLARHDRTLSPTVLIVIVALPPLFYLVTLISNLQLRRLRHDAGYARRRRARTAALRLLKAAAHADPPRRPPAVAAALRQYVADRCNLDAGAVTAEEVLQSLTDRRVDAPLVEEVAQLLADCDAVAYAAADARTPQDIVKRARRCVQRLERERLR